MTMLWNARWAAVTGQRGGAATVQVLRAATIAAVASSCSTMQAQSEPDVSDAAILAADAGDPPYTPPVRPLDKEAELAQQIKDYAAEAYNLPGIALQNIYITVSYREPGAEGQEKLLSLTTDDLPDPDKEVKLNEDSLVLLRIPETADKYKSDYRQVMFIYAGSPDGQTPCAKSGGSNYCDF